MWNPEVRNGYIDGDLIVYAACAKFNDTETFDATRRYLDYAIERIANTIHLDEYTVFVTGGGNFRKEIYPAYKANRKQREKPRWIGECYDYLLKEYGAQREYGYEADDLLGIALTRCPSAILISYDKDLNQIPGWHYDFRKEEMYHVSPQQADRFLALQCLTGDRSDNIPGVKGIGPKKAEAILPHHGTLLDYLEPVLATYYEHQLGWQDFEDQYKCLKILRELTQDWPELEEIKP